MNNKNQYNPFKQLKLDKEELTIEQALAKNEYVSVKNLKKRKEFFKKAVDEYKQLRKSKPITIRINIADLIRVKAKAKENNIPYQTLLSALIRKYAEGKTKVEL